MIIYLFVCLRLFSSSQRMKLSKYICIFLLSFSINVLLIGINGKKFYKRELSDSLNVTTHAWAKYIVIVGIIHRNTFQHYCTGGIINSVAVLTVGQCITLIPKMKQVTGLHVVAGTSFIFENLEDVMPLTQIVQVKEVKLHAKFKQILIKGDNISYWRTDNNLAVLQLQRALNFDGKTADALSLPTKKATSYMLCATLGWPHLFEKGPHSDRIYYHSLNILDEINCDNFYEQHGYDKLCVSNYENIDGNLQYFDLGSPLICQGQIVGISGYDYGHVDSPPEGNIFLDIYGYNDWIRSHIPFVIKYVSADPKESSSHQNYQVLYIFITYIIVLDSIFYA